MLMMLSRSTINFWIQVSQVRMRHLCNDTLVTVVNGKFPGPALEATEGDTVVVHLVNHSPYGITIHWYVPCTCTMHASINGRRRRLLLLP